MENDGPRRMDADSETIQRALTGDRSALAQLYDTYAKSIYRYHYNRVGNAADAEDLTSQTFMAVIEALPRYRHPYNFTAWIFQVARSKAMDYFRGNHRHAEIPESVADPAQVDALEAVVRNESHARLMSMLRVLEEEERELIRLRYIAELSFVEIARMLGRREDAVRKSIRRTLDRLAIQMEAQNA